MSLTNTFENNILKLLFQAVAIANFADNAGTSPVTNLYVSLHTADPGEAGDQITSEAAYTSYARVAVARTAGGWTVTANSVSPAADIVFPAGTGGSGVGLYWGVGTLASGAGVLLLSGPLGSALGPFIGATNDNITIPGLSGVAVDDRIGFFSIPGSTLPTGITEGTVYFVKTVSGDVITIATTSGGTAIDITVAGDGLAFKFTPVTFGNTVQPRLTTATTFVID